MARIRSIKPEFWTSEQVVECSTSARLLFVGLWTFSDDAGRHPDSAKRLKMEIFPGDTWSNEEVGEWVDELVSVGLVERYKCEKGGKYLQICKWKEHQKIDKPTYKHPDPAPKFDEPSTSPRRGVDEPSPPEWSGEEWSGEESKSLEVKNSSGSAQSGGEAPPPRIDAMQLRLHPSTSDGLSKAIQAYPKRATRPATSASWDRALISLHNHNGLTGYQATEWLISQVHAFASRGYETKTIPKLSNWLDDEIWSLKPEDWDVSYGGFDLTDEERKRQETERQLKERFGV